MSDFTLYCFGESGNAYKVALMLELCNAKWQKRWVDFFNGETRTAEYRANVNAMGEAPVLLHGNKTLTQSGAILQYLAGTLRQYGGDSEIERHEVLRWMFFDNHKFTSYLATLRFMLQFSKTGETPVTEFLRSRVTTALKIAEGQLGRTQFIAGNHLTIADLSMCGYIFYDGELPFDFAAYPNISAWRERIRSMPRWKGPYELMAKP